MGVRLRVTKVEVVLQREPDEASSEFFGGLLKRFRVYRVGLRFRV